VSIFQRGFASVADTAALGCQRSVVHVGVRLRPMCAALCANSFSLCKAAALEASDNKLSSWRALERSPSCTANRCAVLKVECRQIQSLNRRLKMVHVAQAIIEEFSFYGRFLEYYKIGIFPGPLRVSPRLG
jgi:hypothetical protein